MYPDSFANQTISNSAFHSAVESTSQLEALQAAGPEDHVDTYPVHREDYLSPSHGGVMTGPQNFESDESLPVLPPQPLQRNRPTPARTYSSARDRSQKAASHLQLPFKHYYTQGNLRAIHGNGSAPYHNHHMTVQEAYPGPGEVNGFQQSQVNFLQSDPRMTGPNDQLPANANPNFYSVYTPSNGTPYSYDAPPTSTFPFEGKGHDFYQAPSGPIIEGREVTGFPFYRNIGAVDLYSRPADGVEREPASPAQVNDSLHSMLPNTQSPVPVAQTESTTRDVLNGHVRSASPGLAYTLPAEAFPHAKRGTAYSPDENFSAPVFVQQAARQLQERNPSLHVGPSSFQREGSMGEGVRFEEPRWQGPYTALSLSERTAAAIASAEEAEAAAAEAAANAAAAAAALEEEDEFATAQQAEREAQTARSAAARAVETAALLEAAVAAGESHSSVERVSGFDALAAGPSLQEGAVATAAVAEAEAAAAAAEEAEAVALASLAALQRQSEAQRKHADFRNGISKASIEEAETQSLPQSVGRPPRRMSRPLLMNTRQRQEAEALWRTHQAQQQAQKQQALQSVYRPEEERIVRRAPESKKRPSLDTRHLRPSTAPGQQDSRPPAVEPTNSNGDFRRSFPLMPAPPVDTRFGGVEYQTAEASLAVKEDSAEEGDSQQKDAAGPRRTSSPPPTGLAITDLPDCQQLDIYEGLQDMGGFPRPQQVEEPSSLTQQLYIRAEADNAKSLQEQEEIRQSYTRRLATVKDILSNTAPEANSRSSRAWRTVPKGSSGARRREASYSRGQRERTAIRSSSTSSREPIEGEGLLDGLPNSIALVPDDLKEQHILQRDTREEQLQEYAALVESRRQILERQEEILANHQLQLEAQSERQQHFLIDAVGNIGRLQQQQLELQHASYMGQQEQALSQQNALQTHALATVAAADAVLAGAGATVASLQLSAERDKEKEKENEKENLPQGKGGRRVRPHSLHVNFAESVLNAEKFIEIQESSAAAAAAASYSLRQSDLVRSGLDFSHAEDGKLN